MMMMRGCSQPPRGEGIKRLSDRQGHQRCYQRVFSWGRTAWQRHSNGTTVSNMIWLPSGILVSAPPECHG